MTRRRQPTAREWLQSRLDRARNRLNDLNVMQYRKGSNQKSVAAMRKAVEIEASYLTHYFSQQYLSQQ